MKAYALEARDYANFQEMVDKALVLENRRAKMDSKRKMEHPGQQGGSNTRLALDHLLVGLYFALDSIVDSRGLNLWVKGFSPLSVRFSVPTSRPHVLL